MEQKWSFAQIKNNYLFIGEVNDKNLEDFKIFNWENRSIVGNIYRGRLLSKIPGLNAFFVDIGLEKNGFLQLPKEEFNLYNEGDELILQVISDEIGNKGAKLRLKYEIKSENIVLTPFSKGIRFSKKIKNEEFKNTFVNMFESITDNKTGVVVRSCAINHTLKDLESEIKIGYEIFTKLEKEKNFSPTPKLLLESNSIENELKFKIDNIVTNDKELYELLNKKNEKVKLDPSFDFSVKNIFYDINNLFQRKVVLDSGVELVFDKTEAFHVIDINSKGSIRKERHSNFLEINKNSVKEIIKQIYFRNLYGIILIDFISLKDKNQEKEVLKYIKEISKNYSNPINVIGFTKLGILELTRSKNTSNLSTENLNKNILR